MENRKASNILEGEASESDEEVSDYPGFIRNISEKAESKPAAAVASEGPSSSVMVTGEASESENEEDEFILRRAFPTMDEKDIHDLEIHTAPDLRRPKFETPFHKKLWECNFAFRLGVVEAQLERYNDLSTRLQEFIPLANSSQNYIQEALKNYRCLSESTKELNDNLENVIQNIDLLPKINLQVEASAQ